MMNRREFLGSSMAAASLLAFAGPLAATSRARTERRMGAQLYTVRKEAERGLPAVLAAIRTIGYTEVETYWDIYNRPAADLRRMIEDHGLRAPSGHFNYAGMESKIDYAKALGVEYVICPMLPESMRQTQDGFKRAAEQFNRWGETIHTAGMQFGFHNHNYEFRQLGNTNGFDTLMAQCDPKLVCIEMDCYWITQAGKDPLKMFRQYGDRIQLLHLKDRKPGFPATQVLNDEAGHFTEVGAGTIAWAAILAAAEKHGVKHFFVERDSGDLPALESLRVSFENLRAIG